MRPIEDARLKEIEALYRSRFPHFVQVATAIVGDREVALEAVQDAFADVVRSRRTFRGEGPLEAWIWRAVVNASYKARRAPDPPTTAAHDRENGYELHDEDGAVLEKVRHASLDTGWWQTFPSPAKFSQSAARALQR